MLYEPLPGTAAVILVQIGIIGQDQVDALGTRTYDAENGRLSLALNDGRTVELERAMHLHSEDGYAVRIRSRAGQTISRSFIHIDRNLAVRNLHNDRMVYMDDATNEAEAAAAQMFADEQSADEASPDFSILASEPLASEPAAPPTLPPGPHLSAHEPAEALDSEDLAAVPELSEQAPGHSHASAPVNAPAAFESDGPMEIDLFEVVPELQAAIKPQTSTPVPVLELEPTQGIEVDLGPGHFPDIHFQDPLSAGDIAETATLSEAGTVVEAASAFRPDPSTTAKSAEADPPQTEDSISAVDFIPEPGPSLETTQIEPVASASHAGHSADPRYIPLRAAFYPAQAADFNWIAETGTIQTYEHRLTCRYIHIDAASGLFYDQRRTPISPAAALKHALQSLPPAVEDQLELPADFQSAAEATSQPRPIPAPAPAAFEPELRTRNTFSNGTQRAAIKPEPTPDAHPLISEPSLSLDAFIRKQNQRQETESWRNRLGRTLRLKSADTDKDRG